MEWLKQLIEKAEIKDNKLDIESLMKEINKEFPKNAMPKDEYNNINNQLKAANKTIKSLEANMSNEDVEKLKSEHKAQIEEMEDKHKTEMHQKELNFALDKDLSSSNCRDVNDIKAFLNMDDIKYQDGKISGLEGQIENLKKSKPYLFNEETNADIKAPTYNTINYNPVAGEGNVDTVASQIANAINGVI